MSNKARQAEADFRTWQKKVEERLKVLDEYVARLACYPHDFGLPEPPKTKKAPTPVRDEGCRCMCFALCSCECACGWEPNEP